MQIVIDIDDNVFTRLFDNDYAIVSDDLFVIDGIAKAIRKGTPLPKGHGRLIDETKIRNCGWNYIGHHAKTDAPTIIEADMAESEE